MKGCLLGSGGGIPTRTRGTGSALLRDTQDALLIDAGTGVAHLVEHPELIEGINRLDVILTHFHLDHVVGLAFLPSLRLPKPACIYGPGRALYDEDTRAILARLLGTPFLAAGWDLPAIAEDIREIGEEQFAVGPFSVTTRVQRLHSDPSLGVRIDDALAYCTDTAYDTDNCEFARGCQSLIHEAWNTSDLLHGVQTHSSGLDAGRIARDAAVVNLILIHINPEVDEDALLREARGIFANTVVGTDLMPLPS
jgi:ribonuclease BN (tRNA processing enzyme)